VHNKRTASGPPRKGDRTVAAKRGATVHRVTSPGSATVIYPCSTAVAKALDDDVTHTTPLHNLSPFSPFSLHAVYTVCLLFCTALQKQCQAPEPTATITEINKKKVK